MSAIYYCLTCIIASEKAMVRKFLTMGILCRDKRYIRKHKSRYLFCKGHQHTRGCVSQSSCQRQ